MHFVKVFKEKYPNDPDYRGQYYGTLYFLLFRQFTPDLDIYAFGERPKVQPTKEFTSNTRINHQILGSYQDFTPAIDYTLKRMLSIYGEASGITNNEFVAVSNNTEVSRGVSPGGGNHTTNRLDYTKEPIYFALRDTFYGVPLTSTPRTAMHYYAYEMEVWKERLTTSEVNARYSALSTKHSF